MEESLSDKELIWFQYQDSPQKVEVQKPTFCRFVTKPFPLLEINGPRSLENSLGKKSSSPQIHLL